MGDQAAYIGPIGAGTIAKLVHNCTSAVMGVALPEVFTMGTKARAKPPAVDPKRVQAILDADKPK